MIKLRRIGHDLFSMEFECGSAKISEEIGLDEIIGVFEEAAHALTDNATRTLIELKDQRLQIAKLKKEAAGPQVTPVAARGVVAHVLRGRLQPRRCIRGGYELCRLNS